MHSALEVNLYRQRQRGLIVADVQDGRESYRFTFGRNQSVNHIWSMIPKLVMDAKFDRMVLGKVAG